MWSSIVLTSPRHAFREASAATEDFTCPSPLDVMQWFTADDGHHQRESELARATMIAACSDAKPDGQGILHRPRIDALPGQGRHGSVRTNARAHPREYSAADSASGKERHRSPRAGSRRVDTGFPTSSWDRLKLVGRSSQKRPHDHDVTGQQEHDASRAKSAVFYEIELMHPASRGRLSSLTANCECAASLSDCAPSLSSAVAALLLLWQLARADRQLIERRLTILKLASLSEHAEYELNYLHEPAPALRATQRIKISRFLLALLYCAVNSGND